MSLFNKLPNEIYINIYKIVFSDTLKIIKESNVFYCYKNFLDWIISNESVYILKF